MDPIFYLELNNFSKAFSIQSWYHSIRHKTCLESAYAIGKHFNPGEYFPGSNRSNKWYNYEAGKHKPNINLVDQINILYPGTKQWLNHPLWTLLNQKKIPQKSLYEITSNIHPKLAKHFSASNTFQYHKRSYKLHNPKTIDALFKQGDMNSLIMLFSIMRDAENKGNKLQFDEAARASIFNLYIVLQQEPLFSIRHDLFKYISEYIYSKSDHLFIGALPRSVNLDKTFSHIRTAFNLAASSNLVTSRDDYGALLYWLWREDIIYLAGEIKPEFGKISCLVKRIEHESNIHKHEYDKPREVFTDNLRVMFEV